MEGCAAPPRVLRFLFFVCLVPKRAAPRPPTTPRGAPARRGRCRRRGHPPRDHASTRLSVPSAARTAPWPSGAVDARGAGRSGVTTEPPRAARRRRPPRALGGGRRARGAAAALHARAGATGDRAEGVFGARNSADVGGRGRRSASQLQCRRPTARDRSGGRRLRAARPAAGLPPARPQALVPWSTCIGVPSCRRQDADSFCFDIWLGSATQ